MYWFPGWPGPVNARSGIGHVPAPASPALPVHPGGGSAAAASPLAGLAAYGVPIALDAQGRPVLQAGAGGMEAMLPPDVPGMPKMPGPPAEFLGGGPGGGGLFRPMAPIAPFNPGNQVHGLHQRDSQTQ